MSDLITVVVPVYNVEKYIRKCVNSILEQVYKEFEVILVDDGSTDTSGIICEDYAKQDARIKVLHKENGGLSSARNYGTIHATGKYICFIDSDDFVEPTYLQYLYDLISRNDSDMAVCSSYWWCSENSYDYYKKDVELCLNPEETFKFLFSLEKWFGLFAWNKLYKLELFENISFPEGKYYEDSGTTYRLVDKCKNVAIGSKPQYYYRQQRIGQITGDFSFVKTNDKLQFLEEMQEFFLKHYPNVMEIYDSYHINCLLTFYEKALQSRETKKDEVSFMKEKITRMKRERIVFRRLATKVKIKLIFFQMGGLFYRLYIWMNTQVRRIKNKHE